MWGSLCTSRQHASANGTIGSARVARNGGCVRPTRRDSLSKKSNTPPLASRPYLAVLASRHQRRRSLLHGASAHPVSILLPQVLIPAQSSGPSTLFLSSSIEPNSFLSSLVPAPSSPSKPDKVTPAPAASSSQRRSMCVSAHWWTFDCADAEKTKRSLVQGDRGTTSCNVVHALRGHRFVFRRRAIWRQPRHCQLTSASS